MVLCCDEKSQIQALQRSQPGLPLGKGHIRTQTHDYYRNGTVTLFAALDYLEGKVIAHTAQKHTHRQWLELLRTCLRMREVWWWDERASLSERSDGGAVGAA